MKENFKCYWIKNDGKIKEISEDKMFQLKSKEKLCIKIGKCYIFVWKGNDFLYLDRKQLATFKELINNGYK